MRALGLCIGASTISAARLEASNSDKPRVIRHLFRFHQGNPRQTLQAVLDEFNPAPSERITVTGRKFRDSVNLSSISEPEAVEQAYAFVKKDGIQCPAIISAGGETFMVYVLNRSGMISNVLTDSKCASGTGEFFLQQLKRLDVSLTEVSTWASEDNPYSISGRCSVFCKSDCTHATNKGISKSRVVSGLCKMMANKVLELIKKIEHRHIMIVGGTVQNRMMIEYLKKNISGLQVPEQAPYFEALGAGLWGLENPTRPYSPRLLLNSGRQVSFDRLEPLQKFRDRVQFKHMESGIIQPNDSCILGLDVGSTTTKAVLIRHPDNAWLAQEYLRTNGDPVGASRQCYRSLIDQIMERVDPAKINIIGLGVCGSGRQIAGLHALTQGVINEIIAHAAAASYFDSGVDTLFEIGGQDAKYTYVTNGVPSDYAMNEACSAGTGSFLEEAAAESLGIPMEEIGEIALRSDSPPNFNDQCAAFISSDIKNAIHEGLNQEDIMAGLVYSICMNYSNRVKGNRPVGNKIFMQGGVCYNRAVPLAMAALVGKSIVVPPEPGLMGAFGVALEVKRRIEKGIIKKKRFDLEQLANRQVFREKSFTCKGGKEKCDRHCEISMLKLENRTYPFGGACNRYDNLRHHRYFDLENLDLVRLRQKLVFEKYATLKPVRSGPKPPIRVGINRSFLVNTYFPLFSVFFSRLGIQPVIPEHIDQRGIDQKNAAFCYPGELSHGYVYQLIHMDDPPEFIFLPHFKAIPAEDPIAGSQLCPFVQGEPFVLKAAFKHQLEQKGIRILTPLLDLAQGIESARNPLVRMAVSLGRTTSAAKAAFKQALERQNQCLAELKQIGRDVLNSLESTPDKTAVVVFGRPYNAFEREAHMGIPGKLASRGITAIPFDFLDFSQEENKAGMYWGMGQMILKAARLVKRHPQLFGAYITNFSCGPDSFIIGNFRDIMAAKPSLTLELDTHTADAGLETRIEAFLDIISNFRQLEMGRIPSIPNGFIPARLEFSRGRIEVRTSSGQLLPLTHSRVTLLFPSMGEVGTPFLAAALRRKGIRAIAYPPSGESELKSGRGNTSCKECLPLILTTGTLLNYVKNRKEKDEILVYFMATGSGPCRFGQYSVYLEELVKRLKLRDVAVMSLTSENTYVDLGTDIQRRAWWAILLSDLMEDLRSALLANARDADTALNLFRQACEGIESCLEAGNFRNLTYFLKATMDKLVEIPAKRPWKQVPGILLSGEIFVRRDPLSRRYLTDRLAEKGFAVICSPVIEWMYYCNFLVENNLSVPPPTLGERVSTRLKQWYMNRTEKQVKAIFSRAGQCHTEPIRTHQLIRNASNHISPHLTGEAILTIGSSLSEVGLNACGVIAIGPFGCMPNRLSEAILRENMKRQVILSKHPADSPLHSILRETEDLPFLAIETDGSPFPQLIQSKLEAFLLQAERLHGEMIKASR